MISETIIDLDVRFVWLHKGVCLFDPTIPWDTMMTLVYMGGCL